jgi:hypothetical protein
MRPIERLVAISILISACVCMGPSQILRRGRVPVISQQIVFMNPVEGATMPPGPGSGIYEIAVMNLDGSAFRQLTYDGTAA